MSNGLGDMLARHQGGSGNAPSRGGGSYSFDSGQPHETAEDFANLSRKDDDPGPASAQLFSNFVMDDPSAGLDENGQKKALPFKNGQPNNQSSASLDDLQNMWADAVNGNGENGEDKSPQEQLAEFNNFISVEAKKLDFFPAERQQELAAAFEKADVKAIATTINAAMQDAALNVMNTAFALVQQEGAKIRDSAVSTANFVRTREAAETQLFSALPPSFSNDPFARQFAIAQLGAAYNKTRNYAKAVEVSISAIEAIKRAAGGGGDNIRPQSSSSFAPTGRSATQQGGRVQRMAINFGNVMGGASDR